MAVHGDGGAGISVTGNGADIVNITLSSGAVVKGGKAGGSHRRRRAVGIKGGSLNILLQGRFDCCVGK